MDHRLEVYMGSYNNTPIVRNMEKTLSINIGDEITKEDWLRVLNIPNGELEIKVKVADIKHQFWDTEDFTHSLSIRVVPVE
jgi:hypothetical protein